MPYKPPRPCNYPLCPNLVSARDKRYCKDHSHLEARSEHTRPYRPQYKRGWDKVRRLKLTIDPLCEDCKEKGITTLATEVHHIVPVREDESLRLDLENLRSVCKSCHSRRTSNEKLKKSLKK